ncbi:MAG: DUF1707 and DUF2154 domain-containing protein [Spirochaetales bacterium]|nr:DUF1707 and DUF2154 domain-containing protein [Spirochaetales bacterium]
MAKNKELDIGISKYARDKVIDRLKAAFANDQLEEKDFEKRVEIATSTRDRKELHILIDDLPADIEVSVKKSPDSISIPINEGEVRESSTYVAVFSGVEKKGTWRPARTNKVIATMGGVDLDFTRAEMPPGVTELNIFAMLGGVEIVVPPGINVDMHGFAFLGGFDDRCSTLQYPGAPTLKIRGFAFLGGIEVRPPKERLMKKIMRKLGLD